MNKPVRRPWVYDMSRHTHDSMIHEEGAMSSDPIYKEKGYIYLEDGGIVGSSEWIWLEKDDAELICKAVNAFAILKQLAEEIMEADWAVPPSRRDLARKALDIIKKDYEVKHG